LENPTNRRIEMNDETGTRITLTGRGWKEWPEVLDAAGAADFDHKEIVAYLEREHSEVSSGWWRRETALPAREARSGS
jgi:hypothetical protein